MRLTRRLARKMLRAEAARIGTDAPMRHASGRRDQARVLLDKRWANREPFECADMRLGVCKCAKCAEVGW